MAKPVYESPNVRISYLLSLSTVFGGGVLCMFSLLFKKLPSHWPNALNPRMIFENSLKSFLFFGNKLTYLTQGQPFAIQLKIVISTIVVSLLSAMIAMQWHGLINYKDFSMNLQSLSLSCFLILAALSLLASHKFLYNLISLSLVGLATSFFFMINGAVDLAMTQLLVEVLVIIIVLIALRDFNFYKTGNNKSMSLINIVISMGFGLYTTSMLLIVTATPFNTQLEEYYIKNSLLLAHGKNVANVILVDFRSFDTFGEVVVIIATAIGVLLLAQKSLLLIRKRHVINS